MDSPGVLRKETLRMRVKMSLRKITGMSTGNPSYLWSNHHHGIGKIHIKVMATSQMGGRLKSFFLSMSQLVFLNLQPISLTGSTCFLDLTTWPREHMLGMHEPGRGQPLGISAVQRD